MAILPVPVDPPVSARPPETLECTPGMQRRFGRADFGRAGLTAGWSFPEDGHVWNEGLDAVLSLSLPERPKDSMVLRLGGEPYVTRHQPTQDVTAYVNGLRAGAWRLGKRQETRLDIPVEPEWWLIRNTRALVRVALSLPNSVRPVDLGDGSDSRELGFCFRTLMLAASSGR